MTAHERIGAARGAAGVAARGAAASRCRANRAAAVRRVGGTAGRRADAVHSGERAEAGARRCRSGRTAAASIPRTAAPPPARARSAGSLPGACARKPAPARHRCRSRRQVPSRTRTHQASRRRRRRCARAAAYVVQVSSQHTKPKRSRPIRALQAKYPSVLGGRDADDPARRSRRQGRRVYRAQVGPFATSEQATAFCDSLKAAGGQCIVQRN